MRRRSFLQSIGAGIAALFVPAVAARQTGPAVPAYLAAPDTWYLSEAALEDAIIEINEFKSSTGKRIAFEPRTLRCYPEARKAAFKLMGI